MSTPATPSESYRVPALWALVLFDKDSDEFEMVKCVGLEQEIRTLARGWHSQLFRAEVALVQDTATSAKGASR